MKRLLLLAAVAPFALSVAHAEPASAPVAASAPPPAAAVATAPVATPAPDAPCCLAPAGTPVNIQLVNMVTTKVVKKGDRFAIRLATPIRVNGKIIVPAGVTGEGEVIDSAHSGLMGKAGELLLAARYLDYNGQRIPLRAFKLGRQGTDNTDLSMVVAMAGVPGAVLSIFIKGGEVEIPAGTWGSAKLAADLTLPELPATTVAEAVPAAAAVTPVSTTPVPATAASSTPSPKADAASPATHP